MHILSSMIFLPYSCNTETIVNIPPLVDVSVSLAVDTPDLQAHAVLHIILQTRDLDLQCRKHAPADIVDIF